MPTAAAPTTSAPTTPTRRRFGELARRWSERAQYAGAGDWLWSLYDRALNSRPGKWLPLRGRTRAVRVVGHERPFLLRLGATDWQVLEELVLHRGYEILRGRDLGAVRHIVDLGANVGLSVRLWQEQYPGARVVAVE